MHVRECYSAFALFFFSGQSCLESNSEIDIPSIRKQYSQSILPGGHQAIIPSHRFNCSGNITEWTIEVTQADKYDFDLQVWRPKDDTQRYVLIGQNSFKRKQPHLPTKISSELGVIQVTPLPKEQLQFEAGDVVGVCVFSYLPKGSGIALLLSDQGNRSLEEVWYARVDKQAIAQDGDCPEATILDTFINAVPAISVSVNITADSGKNVSLDLGMITYYRHGNTGTLHNL